MRTALWLLILFVLPLLISAGLVVSARAEHWSRARWDATGLAPAADTHQEAVIQVYAARTWGWKGAFAVHSWLAYKPEGAAAYERWEVVGWGVREGVPSVRRNLRPPDGRWAGSDPMLLVDLRGAEAAAAIPKIQDAIAKNDLEGDFMGIPVLKYQSVIKGEVKKPGLGPLHTEFDANGNAYTSFFVSSEIVKWSLATLEPVDRVPTYYSIGHLCVPGGDSQKPWGKYVIAYNKITKDRYLPTGPELAQSAQLFSIEGDKMELLLDFPTIGEPHYAQAIPADLVKPREVKFFDINKNQHPFVAKGEKETKVERRGNEVHVWMTTIRSHFTPDNIEGVKMGDVVFFHVTNLEQDGVLPGVLEGDDAVGVDTERDLNLRKASRSGRNAGEVELPQAPVVGRHRTLSLKHMDRHERLIVDARREDLALLDGKVRRCNVGGLDAGGLRVGAGDRERSGGGAQRQCIAASELVRHGIPPCLPSPRCFAGGRRSGTQ